MSLTDFIKVTFDRSWGDRAETEMTEFVEKRYGSRWDKRIQLRINGDINEDAAPFAALIPSGQPRSGPYGGMSFVLFPSKESPSLISLVIGTNGLSPDEEVLGRPGHGRKIRAICRFLSQLTEKAIVWAKHDPVRIDLGLPRQIKDALSAYKNAVSKYEKLIYASVALETEVEQEVVQTAIHSICDLFAEEHGLNILKPYQDEYLSIRSDWMSLVLPQTTEEQVHALLSQRNYVIIEGPPGTGKTRMARRLIQKFYGNHGRTIQFHPETTYESFIGGLSPVPGEGGQGLQFVSRPGQLMEAAAIAIATPDKPFLLHIDEINRADLAKVLGEAIYLLEPDEPDRRINLNYDFGPPFNREFYLPSNLHILGTMNSADRSIAILDIAVRRRFAFIPLWPDNQVLEEETASPQMKEAFQRLFSIFLEEATDDAFSLMPGHSYFLNREKDTKVILQSGLAPLLREYLLQGYVSGFADDIRAYLDRLDSTSL